MAGHLPGKSQKRPFTPSPGSREDEKGLARPFFSGASIPEGCQAYLPLPRGLGGSLKVQAAQALQLD